MGTTFQINSWEDDDWYEPLLKMWQDHGNSSWVLRVGGIDYGRVGLYSGGGNVPYVFLYGAIGYGVINTNGNQIMFHSPLTWNTNNVLEFDETRVSSLLVPVTNEIKEHRLAFLANKPDWHPIKIRRRTTMESAMTAYVEAAIAGGLLSG